MATGSTIQVVSVLLFSVASVAIAGPAYENAVAQLNRFLIDATGSSVINLEENVARARVKDEQGYGESEGDLEAAIKKFLVATSAENCTSEFVDAVSYLAMDEDRNSRINLILRKSPWAGEMREKCRQFPVNLAHEINSSLPNDDTMRAFLNSVRYTPGEHGRYWPKTTSSSRKTELVTPASPNFAHVYIENQGPKYQLAKMAGLVSMPLVEYRRDEVTRKKTRIDKENLYNYLVVNYFGRPCGVMISRGSNYVGLMRFMLANWSDVEQLNRMFNRLAEEVKDVYYRLVACKLYEANKDDPEFKRLMMQGVFRVYSEAHPAEIMREW